MMTDVILELNRDEAMMLLSLLGLFNQRLIDNEYRKNQDVDEDGVISKEQMDEVLTMEYYHTIAEKLRKALGLS